MLSDFNLPRFRGDQALEMVRASKGPDLPFIIISGTIGEEQAVALLKAGANDFIIKTSLARLIPAIDRELRDAQVRRERREAVDGVRRAIAARDEFLLIASHELKTPLTVLMLQLESLSRLARSEGEHKPLSAAQSKTDIIIRQGNRLHVLIESLLDISRVTSGELEIRPIAVDLSKLVRESANQVVELARAARSELQLDIPESLTVRCDPERIEMLVINLLTNAIKFGDGKPIDIILKELGTGARIAVRDRGIGIALEDQAVFLAVSRGRSPPAILAGSASVFGCRSRLPRRTVDSFECGPSPAGDLPSSSSFRGTPRFAWRRRKKDGRNLRPSGSVFLLVRTLRSVTVISGPEDVDGVRRFHHPLSAE